MKRISIVDVRNRLRNIPEGSVNYARSETFREQAEKAIDSRYPSRIIFCIESGLGDTSGSMPEDVMMNLFDTLSEVGTESQVRKYGNMIMREYVSKTRSAKDTQKYLKQKLGRAKSKLTTKVQNNFDDIKNATSTLINAARSNVAKNIAPAVTAATNVAATFKAAEACVEAYENMVQKATDIVAIDRILENYNRISKRFNIDRIIQENTINNGISDTAVEICKLVDTYDMPVKARFNTCLETVWYGLHRNSFTFDESEIVTTIADYYMAKGGNHAACKSILEASIVLDKSQYRGNMDIMTEEEIIQEEKLSAKDKKSMKDSDYGIPSKRKYPMPDESHVRSAIQMFNHVDAEDEAELARNIKKKIKQYGMTVSVGKENRFSKYYSPKNETAFITDAIREFATDNSGYIVIKEEVDFNEILNKFKTSDDEHKESKLRGLVAKLYANSVENVVEGTPNLLAYIRGIFVIGGFAIHPIVGIVGFIADQFIALHMKREESKKMLDAFKAEIRATDKKIASTTDKEESDRLTEYRKALSDAYIKINSYYEGLLTDEELDDKYENDDDGDITGGGNDEFGEFEDMFGDDEFNFDDMDDFGDIDEAARFVGVMSILEDVYSNCEEKEFDQAKCRNMLRVHPPIVNDLGAICKKYPSIISKKDLMGAIDDVKSDYQIGNIKISVIEKYDLSNVYKDIADMKESAHKTSDIFEEAKRFAVQIELVKALNEVYSACIYRSPLTEASFTNSLKLASEKIKKSLQKLSDKDRTISKNIDVSCNNLKKAVERSLTADNREAVIKGSVLPSASKVIKAGIVGAGTAILIDPVIAVIGVLGWIGASAKYRHKERKMVLDEIEIELKMCNKYIELAESKNDLKALRKLYKIQRDLEKQRASIRFHMATKGQKYEAPETSDRVGIE